MEIVKVGDSYKVQLPGETPWAECLAILPDGSWAGRIDNDLVASGSDEYRLKVAQRFFPEATKPIPKLHDFKLNDIVRFAWNPLAGIEEVSRWQPVEWAAGKAN